ncbi:MAG: lipopolysaccharide biosynthesis protein [Neptuniibacter sp.]
MKTKAITSVLLNKGRLYYIAGYMLPVLSVFINTIFLAWYFSDEEFAKFAIYESYLLFQAIVIAMGMDKGVLRFYEDSKLNIRFCVRFSLLVSLLSCFIIWLLTDDFTVSLCLTCCGISLSVQQLVSAVYQKKGDAFSYLRVRTVFFFCGVASIVILYATETKSAAGKYLFDCVLFFLFLIYALPDLSKHFSLKKTESQEHDFLKYSVPFVPALLVSWFFWTSPRLMIEEWWGVDEVGLYTIAQRLCSVISLIGGIFSIRHVPLVFERLDRNLDIRSMMLRNLSLYIMSSLLLFIGLNTAVGLFYSNFEAIKEYLLFIGFGLLVSGISSLSTVPLLLGKKRSVLNLIIGIFGAILFLACSFLMHDLITAVGIVMLLCVVILLVFFIQLFACVYLK